MSPLEIPLACTLVEGSGPGLLPPEGPDLTRYLIVCGALIAVIGLIGWGFRRMFAHSLKVKAAKRSMQVMDVLPLGGKQRLAVVRCYDRTFLLGVGERELSLVSELDGVIQPAPVAGPGLPEQADFARAVDRLLRRRGSAEHGDVQAGPQRTLQPGGILG